MKHSVFPVLLLAIALTACNQVETQVIEASPETAAVLMDLDSSLGAAGSELRIECVSPGTCSIILTTDREPKLIGEMVNHPFYGTPMTYRIRGGTQTLSRALFEALGRHVPTTPDPLGRDRRKLKLQDDKLSLLCRPAPAFECVILISATILKES